MRCFPLLLCSAALFAQPDAPQKLASRAATSSAMLDDTRELCDTVGGRPTGSAACDRAVNWAAKKFRDAGIQKVSVESFTVPRLWLPGTAEASATAPEKVPLRIPAAPLSPSPKGVLDARLGDVGEGSAEGFANTPRTLQVPTPLPRPPHLPTSPT